MSDDRIVALESRLQALELADQREQLMLAELQKNVAELRAIIRSSAGVSGPPQLSSVSVMPVPTQRTPLPEPTPVSTAPADTVVDLSSAVSSQERRASSSALAFDGFLQRLRGAQFAEERTQMLHESVGHGGVFQSGITCEQLGGVVDQLRFEDERLEAVSILSPKLLDRREALSRLLSHFPFDEERAAAREILEL